MSVRIALQVALSVATVGAASIAGAQNTETPSQFRGASRASLPDQEFGLTLLWNRDLGSGYSKITLAGGKAVTMYTAGEVDVIAAFEPASGEEIWRHELGEKYAGHDGSTDGPLSTPAIADGRVFALSPRGRLLALAFDDGSEIWGRDLDESNSSPPFYGFSSSPLIVGDLVILATGGDGHALTAFDPASGETRWASGMDTVAYQTPLLVDLDGRQMLVLVTNQLIQGFDPKSGVVTFEFRHTEGEGIEEVSHIIPVDDQSFVVEYERGSVKYRLANGGLEEVWESRAFGAALAIPVLFDGHLYGFTGRFLTCANAETGEILWRSRPPLGRGIALVDDKLVILAASGELVVVEPSPDGYQELTRTPVFEMGDLATAEFSEGVFYVRNLEQMAAVGVDTSAVPQRAKVAPTKLIHGELGEWAESLLEMPEDERQAAVDKRFANIEASPLFEDGGLAHFYWRGEAEDVGLEGNEVAPGAENGLFKLPGTDLYLRTVELDPQAQYTYELTVDYEQPIPDPRNPHTVDNGFNVVSEVRMPEWPPSPHLETPAEDAQRGELDTFPFHSEILDNRRQIQVWRPPGYGADSDKRYPLLVVNHGDNLLRGGLMRNTLDNLVGESVAPMVAVFVPRIAPPEYAGPQVDDYVRFLVEELLPHIDRHYLTDGVHRAIMGPGSAGVTAVYASLQHSEVFQQAAVQSFYPIEPAQERLPEMIGATKPGPESIYIVWSRHDYELGEGRSAEEASKNMVELLRQGGISITEQIAAYSPGWGGWRGQHDEILEALFPFEEEPEAVP